MSNKTAKTIVITGANRGIGYAMAKICQQRGDNVYALCRQSSAQLDALGVNVVEQVDIATQAGIDKAVSALSGITIDLLINNAGILRNEQLSELNQQTIIEQFKVNALAPLCLSHALLGNLSSGSKIALITSRMGSIADNTSGGRYGYRMSKAALNIAAVSLARDLSEENIAVGIYHPGYVQTEMVNSDGILNNGDISADVAAQRLIALMDNLTMKDSGVFKHSNGETLPW
ncbi:short-chain dehydrogenase [Colwellia sp. MT41]|uniref:Short-chain dehydrogenase n=1 Tax=Colwellia marinimaniae TaxID=1513592 RepID=A0ABQ0MQM0_9GAMM|nr:MULTISPECIES: SDR family oxidoreductase [Colwellia]ALO35852.1 short-chain dehydrogenase [Colwellia sp. MT41]GAW94664.1 short-chain dehydrogenase [Colwellia marinimaniae]